MTYINNVTIFPGRATFTSEQSIAIDFIGTSRLIDNTMFGSQRVKDAVVDRIRRVEGERPNVDTKNPDIRIQVRQHKGRVTVSLDISGESLHRRGYRSWAGQRTHQRKSRRSPIVARWLARDGRRGWRTARSHVW